MNDIYYKTGQTFTFEGKEYVCKENKKDLVTCMKCVFKSASDCAYMQCVSEKRKDGKDVYFEEIKQILKAIE